ncbi:hypothetical protein ACN27B_08820 [Micromonospora sp. WMMD754]|uniref:hypothetical protein n=1 Tax=Micromonospora sp. WMMD754 TaxID=3404114 RepID=UPI003BF533AC
MRFTVDPSAGCFAHPQSVITITQRRRILFCRFRNLADVCRIASDCRRSRPPQYADPIAAQDPTTPSVM